VPGVPLSWVNCPDLTGKLQAALLLGLFCLAQAGENQEIRDTVRKYYVNSFEVKKDCKMAQSNPLKKGLCHADT
jgi:hypothetical protein